MLVIAELLGAPSSDIAALRAWSQAIVRMYEPSVSPDVQDAALSASRDFADYMRALIVDAALRARGRPAQRPDPRPGR